MAVTAASERQRVRFDALSNGQTCVHNVRQDDVGPRLAAPLHRSTYEGGAAKVHGPNEPLRYPWGDEYRSSDQLADIATQLVGKPLTLPHPTDLFRNGGTGRIIGVVDDAWVDGDYVVARFTVTDPDAVDQIARGVVDLSLGYASQTGEDGYQRNIQVDHLAVVPRGRCQTCELRADAEGGAGCSAPIAKQDCDCGCAGACGVQGIRQVADPQTGSPAIGEPSMDCTMSDADKSKERTDAKLNAEQRHKIPSHLFAVPSREALPLEDETHVRDAMARFESEHFTGPAEKKSAFHKIVARAHELGIDPKDFVKKHGKEAGVRADDDFTGDPANDTEKDTPSPKKDDDADASMMDAKSKDEIKRLKDALEKAEMDRDNARKDADRFSKEMDGHKKAREDAEARAEKAEFLAAGALKSMEQAKDNKMDAAIAEAVTAKVKLLARVNEVLPEDKRVDAASPDRDIKCALVKHVDGDEIATDKSDQYVDGMFEGAMKRAKTGADSRVVARIVTGEQRRADAAPETATALGASPRFTEAELKKRMAEEASAAWQRPVHD